MNNAESYEGLQRARTSLEEKAKTLEEKARKEKLAIDKKLAVEILEEENRTHNDAVRELEARIADLEQQMNPSRSVESNPAPSIPEPAQEVSENVGDDVSIGVLQEPQQNVVEELQEGHKKKRRNLF